MADATQVQRRRGTEAQCDGMTPAEAEVIVDLTNDTLRVGDGIRAGGFIMPNFSHIQRQSFGYAVSAGTGNAITVALSPALLAYADGVALEFKASNNNTGATTLDVNGLGAKSIKKLSGGVLTDVSSGDIVAGIVYRVTYDGTQFQVTNAEFSPPAPTGGLVKISTTSISAVWPASTTIALPSGYSSFRLDITSLRATSANVVSFNVNSVGILSASVTTSLVQFGTGFFEIVNGAANFMANGIIFSDSTTEGAGGSMAAPATSFNIQPSISQTLTGTATLYGRH